MARRHEVLKVPGAWVWDFWLADDGEQYHVFFLTAPTSLIDPHRRHRAARIGHAVSTDLVEWVHLDEPFGPGERGSFDETATWTGSVVRGHDGLWRMFYTGSRFLWPEPASAHVESVGVATSPDLLHWEKQPGPVVEADPRWYETRADSAWQGLAWRDPWLFADPDGNGWHMLVTATANEGPAHDRGVLGHAVSRDLETWEVLPPLSSPGAGFGHLEVPQVACLDGRWCLLFSCGAGMLTVERQARFPHPGTWILPVADPRGSLDVASAVPLTGEDLYSGRLAQRRDGSWALLAVRNSIDATPFPGFVIDPIPVAPTIATLPSQLRDLSSADAGGQA